ncbi:MAG: 30S ribosome-binding factor RbfA [Anaerovoracaceae bacterium]|nr:30S ribosome-binding factor RbfA [Anaerovoracaceae bacterium]
MGKGYRQGRLGEEIRRIISEMLIHGVKDPRLSGMISLTGVEVTSDGSYATCFVSILGLNQNQEERQKEAEDVLAGLNSAKGLFKREIGHQIKLRHVPELIFKIDESLEYGRHISEIIGTLGIENYQSDEEVDDEEIDSEEYTENER